MFKLGRISIKSTRSHTPFTSVEHPSVGGVTLCVRHKTHPGNLGTEDTPTSRIRSTSIAYIISTRQQQGLGCSCWKPRNLLQISCKRLGSVRRASVCLPFSRSKLPYCTSFSAMTSAFSRSRSARTFLSSAASVPIDSLSCQTADSKGDKKEDETARFQNLHDQEGWGKRARERAAARAFCLLRKLTFSWAKSFHSDCLHRGAGILHSESSSSRSRQPGRHLTA